MLQAPVFSCISHSLGVTVIGHGTTFFLFTFYVYFSNSLQTLCLHCYNKYMDNLRESPK